MQAYSDPSRETDPHALPDIEVFYAKSGELSNDGMGDYSDIEEPSEAGWYYWFCFPGCLPDSDPIGPFDTEEQALQDAQDND